MQDPLEIELRCCIFQTTVARNKHHTSQNIKTQLPVSSPHPSSARRGNGFRWWSAPYAGHRTLSNVARFHTLRFAKSFSSDSERHPLVACDALLIYVKIGFDFFPDFFLRIQYGVRLACEENIKLK